MHKHYVILGNGIAGFSAASGIRKVCPKAEITMVSDEPDSTYLRPLLTKMSGKTFRKNRMDVVGPKWYAEHKIKELLHTKVAQIDPRKHHILMEDGRNLSFDTCIYALGAHSFLPDFPGKQKEGVCTLRTIGDWNQIRRRTAYASHAVIIGGGAIGLETAWEISRLGCQVTVLESAPRLFGHLLDSRSSSFLEKRIHSAGVSCHTGAAVRELTGSDTVTGVMISDGTWFPADLVIVSCGIRANTAVAARSGIACDRGVLVNEFLETSQPDIYAAGDCIQWSKANPGLWNFARVSGEAAGYFAASEDRSQAFSYQNEPVLFHIMGTSVFQCGRLEEEGEEHIVMCPTDSKRFFVNPPEGMFPSYQKRCYQNGKLCGAVLIGDLTDMQEIKRELAGGMGHES